MQLWIHGGGGGGGQGFTLTPFETKLFEPRHEIANNLPFLTSVDWDEPLQPPFKLRYSKWCSVSSLTIIEYSSN